MKRKGLILVLTILSVLITSAVIACAAPQSYTITFVTNGAEPIAAITAKAGEDITPPADPVRQGYIFGGWYLDEDLSGDAQALPTVMPAENRTYYAKFDVAEYTVTLDPSGGTIATSSYSVAYGANLYEFLQDKQPTRGGLRFAGWFLADRAVTIGDTVTQSVTVTAQWEAPYTVEVYLQQLNAEQTAASDNYALSEEHAASGWAKLGDDFYAGIYIEHYELNAEHENSVVIKNIEESGNSFKLYFTRETYTISYNANAEDKFTGSMADEKYPYGAIVSLKACAFDRENCIFAAWSLDKNKLITPPTTAFRISQNYVVYALWDRGYVNEKDNTDIVYVSAVITSGLGRAYRFENGVKKEGFLDENTYIPWVFEFTFMYDAADQIGRIDTASGTFRYRGDEEGVYIYFDYATEQYVMQVLYLDGYGESVIGDVDAGGGINFGNTFGVYSYYTTYDDYTFTYIDVATQEETGDYFYFRLGEISGDKASGFKGLFMVQGYESGTYLLFDVFTSELLYSYVLELDGYGNAREKFIDPTDEHAEQETLSVGTYRATADYEDYMGEWKYIASSGETYLSRFILNSVAYDDGYIAVYLMYDEALVGTLAASSGSNARLVLGGYNSALYYPNGTSGAAISGAFLVSKEVNLSFIPYEDGEATGLMLFVIDWTPSGEFIGTFTLNEDGFIVDAEGTLTGYVGASPYVEIPGRVTAIADDAMSYLHIDVSLRTVVIPSSVKAIGKRAFENNYTLSQAVFLSDTPIEIDWSSTVSPFRWPRGDFVIIVPEGSEDVYRTAWADCPYKIASLTEINNRPEWEIEDGVLISYNNKDDDPHDLDLKIPDGVTEIAAKVFFALDYIRSVDLNNVVTVGEQAFAQVATLVSVKADKVQTLELGAFALCTALKEITLPAVKTVGEQAFAGCYLLTRATLGAGLVEIGSNAFSYCAADADDPTIFVVLEGTDAPAIGGNVFYGCVARRISVDTVATALKLLGANDWRSYALSLWVREAEQSALVGEWVDLKGLQPVTFNGRAELFLFEVWLYEIKDSAVTFYISDSSAQGYSAINGTYQNGKISFTYGDTAYVLVRADGKVTYTNGGDTLILDLSEADYSGMPFVVPATLNGTPITLNATFTQITATGVVMDGRKYNLTFTLNNDLTFDYKSSLVDKLGPFTAADGSTVSISYSGSLIFATGTLNIDGNKITGTVGWLTVQDSDTTFTVTIPWLSTTYFVTVVITGESTFTYSYVVGASRKVIPSSNNAGAIVAVYDKDGKLSALQLMLPSVTGGTNETVECTYELQDDGSYLFIVDFMVEKFNEITQQVYYEPSPLNGTYRVTIDFDGGTCTIVKEA